MPQLLLQLCKLFDVAPLPGCIWGGSVGWTDVRSSRHYIRSACNFRPKMWMLLLWVLWHCHFIPFQTQYFIEEIKLWQSVPRGHLPIWTSMTRVWFYSEELVAEEQRGTPLERVRGKHCPYYCVTRALGVSIMWASEGSPIHLSDSIYHITGLPARLKTISEALRRDKETSNTNASRELVCSGVRAERRLGQGHWSLTWSQFLGSSLAFPPSTRHLKRKVINSP